MTSRCRPRFCVTWLFDRKWSRRRCKNILHLNSMLFSAWEQIWPFLHMTITVGSWSRGPAHFVWSLHVYVDYELLSVIWHCVWTFASYFLRLLSLPHIVTLKFQTVYTSEICWFDGTILSLVSMSVQRDHSIGKQIMNIVVSCSSASSWCVT